MSFNLRLLYLGISNSFNIKIHNQINSLSIIFKFEIKVSRFEFEKKSSGFKK
jgi:hypothetical protein